MTLLPPNTQYNKASTTLCQEKSVGLMKLAVWAKSAPATPAKNALNKKDIIL